MSKVDNLSIEDVVRRYVPGDLALYSLWMPGDISTAAIQRTVLDPVQTFDEIIELDDVLDLCVAYLEQNGVPVFTSALLQEAYVDALEEQLRGGAQPSEAREVALEIVTATPRAQAAVRYAKTAG